MSSKNIVNVTSSLTKAADCKEDTALLTKANANWEEYLTPAPMSIAFLGELVFISANKDFSIKDGGPTGGFKFIKYPDSFRACLMHVCNFGWDAFNEAHKNMNEICLLTNSVPTFMERAVKILLQENDDLIELLLSDILKAISDTSSQCVSLAKSSEQKFIDVINLISELLETCTNSKQSYGLKLEEVRKNLDAENLRTKLLKEEKKQAQEELKKQGKMIDDLNQKFNEALKSLPSGWESIGMNFVEGLTNIVNDILGTIGHIMINRYLGPTNQDSDKENPQGGPATVGHPGNNSNYIFFKCCLLLPSVQSLRSFIQEDQIQWNGDTMKTMCDWIKKKVETMEIPDVNDSPAKHLAEMISREAISICSDLIQMTPKGKHDDADKNKDLVQRIKELLKSAQQFDSMGKKEFNTSSFPVLPPQKATAQSSKSSSASESATQNTRLRIEQMRTLLDQAKQEYDKSLDKMEQKNSELTEILIKMRSCDVEKIDFETTIKFLIMGLKAMGRLQETWRKMVQFFEMMSNIIDTSLKSSLKDFVDTAKKPLPKDMKYSSKMFLQDVLYHQVFHASNIASLINMISGTYTEISRDYLMDRVGSLNTIMALDPKDSQFQVERVALGASCDEAVKGILARVLKNRDEYQSKTKARIQKIKDELDAVLPPQSKEEEEEIRHVVAAGFKDDPDIHTFF